MENVKNKIIDIFHKYNTFALLPHISPDADTIGSCCAVAEMIENMGKQAVVFVEEELPSYLAFLGGKYKTFTQPKRFDVCICIDCGDIGRVGARSALFSEASLIVNIDHHYANTKFADINLVDDSSSSAGEICYELLSKMDAVTQNIAFYLYTAICADTGGFKFSNTAPKTLRAAADLLEYSINAAKINKLLFDTESYSVFQIKGEIMRGTELFCKGRAALVSADIELMRRFDTDSKEIDNIIDIARRIEGVEVAVSLKESKAGIKISLRSNERVDVSKIAEKFDGGGHVRAAGILMETDMSTAKRLLMEEVASAIGETEK